MNSTCWHVLGVGAIGSLFASKLADSGSEVCLVLKNPEQQQAWQHGKHLRIQTLSGEQRRYQLNTTVAYEHHYLSQVLVTTKAFDVLPAIRAISHRLNHRSVIVLMVNGMGVEQEVLNEFPDYDIYNGTTTEGAFRLAPFQVQHAGSGQTLFGQAGRPAAPAWLQTWQKTALDCHWEADIERAMWRKLAVNCVVNPLTALNDCPNSELLHNANLAQQVVALCTEIAPIMTAAGHPVTASELLSDVQRVIRGTADNRSSMWQDVAAGRRSEIDYITGYLTRTAQKLQLASPINRGILEQLSVHR